MLRNQSGGAAAEVLLKFCLVFVISLFAFAVGTFVGKKFTEDQHRLATLDGTVEQKRQAASVQDISDMVKPDNPVDENDIASLSEAFSDSENAEIAAALADRDVAAEEIAAKALEQLDKDLEEMKEGAKAKPAAPAKEARAPNSVNKDNNANVKKDEASQVAKRIAENEKEVVVAPPKKVDRKPSSYPKLQASAAAGKYTVQVASYKTEKEAKAMVNDLNNKGYTSFYVEATVKDSKWYRVSVGMFTTQNAANTFMTKLYEEAKLKGFVTRVVK